MLRDDTQRIKDLILRKESAFDIDRLIELNEQAHSLRLDIESLRKERNELSSLKSGQITEQVRKQSISIGKRIKEKEQTQSSIQKEFEKLWFSCPNVPHSDVPLGGKEANETVRVIGEKPVFGFELKNHLELNESLNWFDFNTAASMSGSHFVLYKNDAVKVIYALTRMMLKNNVLHGFKPVIPPYLVKSQALFNSGNLPKFEGDYYHMSDDDLCLIPTAEASLTNMHAETILSADQLPIRYTAWTGCFRREAGGYGAQDRGLVRIHQFEKVEIYSLTTPEQSDNELERMVSCAEKLLQQLGLHYRVCLLAAQDCSFCSAKTYDIEIWLPGQNEYYEVSSCSNCTDFQARRAGIRYRTSPKEKLQFAHTLNASSLALPRLMVALMEQYQQKDGSVKLPPLLKKEMDALW
jgi:seryl-tRNA synthetase